MATSSSSLSYDSDAISQLRHLVESLRDINSGCPWSLEQTHISLTPYILEEAYEVVDAIKHGNDDDICEELGDLLLQIMLHTCIAAEEKRFDLDSVARAISNKLIRRHPHVFSDIRVSDSDAVRRNWEIIKLQERSAKSNMQEASITPISNQLRERVRSQPALFGAMTISERAAQAGFEWNNISGVWNKVQEELDELKEAIDRCNLDHAQAELGDLLFALVNIARWCGISPEEGLAGTNCRFLDRFRRIEVALSGDLTGQNIKELEILWQQAKLDIQKESLARDQDTVDDNTKFS